MAIQVDYSLNTLVEFNSVLNVYFVTIWMLTTLWCYLYQEKRISKDVYLVVW